MLSVPETSCVYSSIGFKVAASLWEHLGLLSVNMDWIILSLFMAVVVWGFHPEALPLGSK